MYTLNAPFHEIHPKDTPDGVSSFCPKRPGVVVFFADNGQTILISSASDARAFVEERLGVHRDQHPSKRRVDLAPVTNMIRVYPCGIGLETQWILARLAGIHDPDLRKELFDRASNAFLIFSNSASRWSVVGSGSLSDSGGMDAGVVIGPIPRTQDASALGEFLDDAFSLCRYPNELALAPNGNPCVYKDMGRCPAACDGSEPMEQYQSRLHDAISLVRGGVASAKTTCQGRIAESSGSMDFESAAEHKRILDALNKLAGDRYRGSRSIAAMRWLVVAPSARRGWAGVWVFGGAGLGCIAMIEDGCASGVVRRALDAAGAVAGVGEINERVMMDLGLVARELNAKPGRGRRRVSRVFDLDAEVSISDLQCAIAHASNPPEEGGDDSEPKITHE